MSFLLWTAKNEKVVHEGKEKRSGKRQEEEI